MKGVNPYNRIYKINYISYKGINMKSLTKNGLYIPIVVVLMWLIREFYLLINLSWSNGFTLQYILIFYILAMSFQVNEKKFQAYMFVLGSIFCLLGDTFLANAMSHYVNLGSMRMPLGIAGFFVGHTFWFIGTLQFKDKVSSKKTYLSFLITFTFMVVLWFILINNNFNFLSILALVYCVALGTPLAYSIARVKLNRNYVLLTIFYSIFIFSDLLIGMHEIKGIDIPIYGFLVWFTYIIALSGITYALVSHRNKSDN